MLQKFFWFLFGNDRKASEKRIIIALNKAGWGKLTKPEQLLVLCGLSNREIGQLRDIFKD
jgi:hypothetical protein